MIKTEFKLEYKCEDIEKQRFSVIVVAAGGSSRMQGINKQLLEIGGVPVIARTLCCFEASPLISKIIVVTKEEIIADIQKIAIKYNVTKISDITVGGKDRFSSVLNGIKLLSNDDKKVLIHDGARPFVEPQHIGNVCAALQNYDCAVCAVPVKDTIKIADDNGIVSKTPQRHFLYAVQTPQGVDVELYKKAVEGIEDTSLVTDDASVMEAAGYTVKIVEGSYKNIKITTPDDILLADFLLKGE